MKARLMLPPDREDEDRKLVLARRARFLAAAATLAGLSQSGACARDSEPRACLSPPHFEVNVPPTDGGDDEIVEGGESVLGQPEGAARPEPPEEPAPPPRICLSEDFY